MDFIWHSVTSGVVGTESKGYLEKAPKLQDTDKDNDKGYLESLLGCAMHLYDMYELFSSL